MNLTIDAAYFREKVRVCLQLAQGLPWDSPARYQLLLMAEDFQVREIELESPAPLANRLAPALERQVSRVAF